MSDHDNSRQDLLQQMEGDIISSQQDPSEKQRAQHDKKSSNISDNYRQASSRKSQEMLMKQNEENKQSEVEINDQNDQNLEFEDTGPIEINASENQQIPQDSNIHPSMIPLGQDYTTVGMVAKTVDISEQNILLAGQNNAQEPINEMNALGNQHGSFNKNSKGKIHPFSPMHEDQNKLSIEVPASEKSMRNKTSIIDPVNSDKEAFLQTQDQLMAMSNFKKDANVTNFKSPTGSSTIKGPKSQQEKNKQVAFENQDELEMVSHMFEKRPQLGDLSLADIEPMSEAQKKNFLMQNKMIRDLKKIKSAKPDEKDLKSDDEESDDPLDLEDFVPGSKDQSKNKGIFRDNYGVEMQYPGFYILDAKVYPKDLNYLVRVVRFVAPNKDKQQYRTFHTKRLPEVNEVIHLDGGEVESLQDSFYEIKEPRNINPEFFDQNTCVLQLFYKKKTHLSKIAEIPYNKDIRVSIQFSPDGNLMSVFSKKQHKIVIYDLVKTKLQEIFKDIPNETMALRKYKHTELNKNYGNCKFDKYGRYFAIYGDFQAMIFDLNQNESRFLKEYSIDEDQFEKILDLQIAKENDSFRCDVACKKKNETIVSIWTLNSLQEFDAKETNYNSRPKPKYHIDPKKQLFYIHKTTKDYKYAELMVKISSNFNKTVLAFGKDSYELSEEDGEFTQRMIQWLNKKRISQIKDIGSEFLFVTHRDFGKTYEVRSSSSEDLKILIHEVIAPGSNFKIFDLVQSQSVSQSKNGYFGDRIVLLTTRDSNFHYYDLNPAENECVDSLLMKNICSRSAMWPYVCLADQYNQIWIYCSYDYNIVKRILLPYEQKNSRAEQIFITSEFDLFILVNHFRDKTYELICIDLDEPRTFLKFEDQKFSIKSYFKYSYGDIHNQPASDIMIRSASKNAETVNKKLLCFIVHHESLYSWVQGDKKLQLVSKTSSTKIRLLHQEEFIYNKWFEDEEDRNRQQEIVKVTLRFSTFIEQELFKAKAPIGSRIKALEVDIQAGKVVVMQSTKLTPGKKKFIIYELDSGKRIGVSWVTDSEIIGRFASKQFTLIDGHMYFDNSVFKIRYDTMIHTKSDYVDEANLIDKYENLLDLKKGEMVLAKMPKFSLVCHKQVYISSNPLFKQPYRLFMLPYLHERKLYLNLMKSTNKYFYNIFECIENDKVKNYMLAFDMSADKIFVYSEGGLLIERISYKEITQKYGKPFKVSPNGQVFLFGKESRGIVHMFKIIRNYQQQSFKFRMIKDIDIKESLKLYAEDYVKAKFNTDEYEQAISTQKRLKDDFSRFLIESNCQYDYQVNDTGDFVVEISNIIDLQLQEQVNRLVPKKESKVFEEILDLSARLGKLKMQMKKKKDDGQDISNQKSQAEKMENQIQLKKKKLSTDTQDTLKRLSSGQQLNLKQSIDSLQGSIIYICEGDDHFDNDNQPPFDLEESPINQNRDMGEYSSNEVIQISKVGKKRSFFSSKKTDLQINLEEKLKKQKLFFTKDYEYFDESYKVGNFTLSEKYVVFWNQFKSWKLDFDSDESDKKQEPEMDLFCLIVDKNNQDSYIKKAIIGPQPEKSKKKDTMFFVIRQSKTADMMVLWDIKNNCEITSFDTSINSKVLYDSDGSPYILDGDHVIVTEQGVMLKSYDIQSIAKSDQLAFQISSGVHFDSENHNFLMLNEYVSLSFSFMTFVIRDRHQNMEKEEKYAYDNDIEMYNYNINRKTYLTCDNFVKDNIEDLEQSLKFLIERDKKMLDILHYYYVQQNKQEDGEIIEERVAPLHLALENNRSANIILYYMSLVDYNASETFKDIMYKCVELTKFIQYIDELPFQTLEMSFKQTLSIKEAQDDKIVVVESSPFSFVDNYYYEKELGEYIHEENTNFLIKMQALRVDWIFDKDGKKMLEAISISDNDELFESPTIQVIIEFLYFKYRKAVLKLGLPFYLLQLIAFYMSILIPVEVDATEKKWYQMIPLVVDYFNIISVLYTISQVFLNVKHLGWLAFKSLWVYLDMFYFIVLTLISSSRIADANSPSGETPFLGEQQYRTLQSLICITIFLRLMYYLQLIDQIAPLITIVIKIFADILWFMVIFILIVFAFGNSFQLIGQNQSEQLNAKAAEVVKKLAIASPKASKDDLLEQAMEQVTGGNDPDYFNFWSAFTHVYRLALGDFQVDMYQAGDTDSSTMLMFYWYLASFILQIHLLNMLIAIMGDTFSQNNEKKYIQSIRTHLSFVLLNWWREPLEDKERIKYLIMGFAKEEENEEAEMLQKLQKNQNALEMLIQDQFDDLNERIDATTANLMHSMEEVQKKQDGMNKKWNDEEN